MRILPHKLPAGPAPSNEYQPQYPNPADFAFNYYNLMKRAWAQGTPIGYAPSAKAVAIIGGGVAGIAAARELRRAGYTVTIYEATSRICGRHYTAPSFPLRTGMELGAMRFPYFGDGSEAAGSANCLFDYYLTFEAGKAGHAGQTSPFPNPGAAPGGTGVYMNQGFGPNDEFSVPTMIIWEPNTTINDSYLAPVSQLVNNFVSTFTSQVAPVYGTPQWSSMWHQIANQYDKMSFSDLVFARAMPPNDYQNDGWLGGFGMNDLQSELFYTIGSGDGSWGAFYEVGAMWFIRCVMFGFNSNLQAMTGLSNATSAPAYNDSYFDSNGVAMLPPTYQGIQALTQWLFYGTTPGMNSSLADMMNDAQGVSLFQNTPASRVRKNPNGSITVTDSNGIDRQFAYVVVTAPIWASQMSIDFEGFSPAQLPFTANVARSEQHIIASTKVFFPLKKTYWEVSNIPQILVTDSFVQDAYGVQWGNDTGVLLASYTWEDDAVKLDPYSTNTQDPYSNDNIELANRVITELDRITMSTLNDAISNYVDTSNPVVWRWAAARGYNGCAKLYRQRNWDQNYALLAYNQNNGPLSGLFFAGESYSVEGGWTEPALRLAIDAVIRLLQTDRASFMPGFSPYNDYPTFPTWDIDETYDHGGSGVRPAPTAGTNESVNLSVSREGQTVTANVTRGADGLDVHLHLGRDEKP